ncbi:MAG TPA: thioredoxin family protein [Burkholderiales bacterium]|jgi:peroxiredoxin|nr:thioredoxin family protein [Burkholderiales bacterium]
MNKLVATSLAVSLAVLVSAAQAAVAPGQAAPEFSLVDINGKVQNLSGYRGKYVVLEWFNSECPFVQKHYESGNMQALQVRYTQKGVVWLGINSTSPRHSNYRDPARSQAILKEWKSAPTAFVLDPDGRVGKQYGARTTPHMYVIDPKGTLVYVGGIDDKPSTSQRDIPTARNLVAAALDESLSGKPVGTPSAMPYGCSVKYDN